MVHVLCAAHGLNRVALEVHQGFPLVNHAISNVKKVFLKSPARIRLFKANCPKLPLPPEPVCTRWGTWLTAASYLCKNVDDVKKVIDHLDPQEAASIQVYLY